MFSILIFLIIMKKKSKPKWVKEIAQQRIQELMQQAEENKTTHPERSRRYCELATKISQKYKVKLGKYKHKFCKNCYTYYTIETMKKRKIPKTNLFQITCLHCGKQTKIGVVLKDKTVRTKKLNKKAINKKNKQKVMKNESIKKTIKTTVK